MSIHGIYTLYKNCLLRASTVDLEALQEATVEAGPCPHMRLVAPHLHTPART